MQKSFAFYQCWVLNRRAICLLAICHEEEEEDEEEEGEEEEEEE